MADDEKSTLSRIRRFFSLGTIWKAINLPWWAWLTILGAGLLTVWVLLKEVVFYAIIVAVVFFGSKLLIAKIRKRGKKNGGEPHRRSRIEPLSRRH